MENPDDGDCLYHEIFVYNIFCPSADTHNVNGSSIS
jgi:hypothetical protein